MSGEKERVDAYLATLARLEPDVAAIDVSAFYASAAISLKRIADVLAQNVSERPSQVVVMDAAGNNAMADYLATNGGGVHVYRVGISIVWK